MALRHKDERFTKWMHIEDGQVMHRRLHRLEVQSRDGRLHIITGDKLPEFIGTFAGQGYRGAHVAQILLYPESISVASSMSPEQVTPLGAWPVGRDIVHMVLGMVGFLAVRFFVNLVAGMS
jgi:hypothetical protein